MNKLGYTLCLAIMTGLLNPKLFLLLFNSKIILFTYLYPWTQAAFIIVLVKHLLDILVFYGFPFDITITLITSVIELIAASQKFPLLVDIPLDLSISETFHVYTGEKENHFG